MPPNKAMVYVDDSICYQRSEPVHCRVLESDKVSFVVPRSPIPTQDKNSAHCGAFHPFTQVS